MQIRIVYSVSFICFLNLLAKINAKSHCLHFNDLSPEWIFICILNLLAKINAKSHCLPCLSIPCCCCRLDHCQKWQSQAHRGSLYLNTPRWAWAGTAGCPSSRRSRKTSRFEMFSYDDVGKELILKNYPYILMCHGEFSSFVNIS